MAEEALPSTEELKAVSEKLFDLLSKEDMTENEKFTVRETIEQYPQILGWKDFNAKISQPDLMKEYNEGRPLDKLLEDFSTSKARTQRVLDHLQNIKDTIDIPSLKNPAGYALDEGKAANGETIGTQMVKNVSFLQSLANDEKLSDSDRLKVKEQAEAGYGFLTASYSKDGAYQANPERRNIQGQKVSDIIKNVVEDRKSLQVQTENNPQAAPKKTLTIEELKDKAYQGTLTVEQADQLRKHEDMKKVAEMKSIPGDFKKTKHKSDDKFKDEDVIKYMYENWFLGGLSGALNWIEDTVLNTIDSAAELCAQRASVRRGKKDEARQEKLGGAYSKANEFTDLSNEVINSLGANCQAKQNSYNAIFDELRNNLGNPNANWQHFDKNDPFIKQLEANPQKAAEFINSASQELNNRTKMVEATGKLATMMASIGMMDDFMGNNRVWRNEDGEYLSKDALKAELLEKSQKIQTDLFKAIAVISEDTRLLSEEAYNRLENPTVDLMTFTQQNVNKEVNKFLKEVADGVKEASQEQQTGISEKRFNDFSDFLVSKGRKVTKTLNKAERLIQRKINGAYIYDSKLFADEHSKERIKAKVGLYEEAVQINSPQGLGRVFERVKTLNGYQQTSLEEMRRDAKSRKEKVSKFKNQIVSRDTPGNIRLFGKNTRVIG